MQRSATPFTGGGAIQLQYHTALTAAHAGNIPASVLTTPGAGNSLTFLMGLSGLAVPVNDGIDLTNATAAFAGGTGKAFLHLAYYSLKFSV
jgi:hypothetical protein